MYVGERRGRKEEKEKKHSVREVGYFLPLLWSIKKKKKVLQQIS